MQWRTEHCRPRGLLCSVRTRIRLCRPDHRAGSLTHSQKPEPPVQMRCLVCPLLRSTVLQRSCASRYPGRTWLMPRRCAARTVGPVDWRKGVLESGGGPIPFQAGHLSIGTSGKISPVLEVEFGSIVRKGMPDRPQIAAVCTRRRRAASPAQTRVTAAMTRAAVRQTTVNPCNWDTCPWSSMPAGRVRSRSRVA